MERREEALREALSNNNQEISRWELFKKENETAIENLENFSKNLTVDVMVPLGRKAFMPGQLIHTNEVLVGHYQGYFSKCSSYKAKQICDLRINRAKDQLEKLQTEAEFWQNKLEKPYAAGVLPSAEEREIIEDYDEEKEKKWREAHRLSLKQAKLKEKSERENKDVPLLKENVEKDDKDIFEMLEEAEIMEELEKELNSLEIDNVSEDTVKKLLAGEIPVPQQKPRVAHTTRDEGKSADDMRLNGVVKKTDITKKPPAANNNTRRNTEIETFDNDEDSIETNEELTEEVRIIQDQAKFLPPSDQVGFYEYQVEIIRKKISALRLTNEEDINEKLHLLAVQDELDDLLALAEFEVEINESTNEENLNSGEEEQKEVTEEIKESNPQDVETKSTQKRQISFALENETLLFRRNEPVSQLLPKDKDVEASRDIIKLDDTTLSPEPKLIAEILTSPSRQESIWEKVEKNFSFASRNQSKKDCDLVTKILDAKDLENEKTIYIKFEHSAVDKIKSESNLVEGNNLDSEFVPENPSDFYRFYEMQLSKENQKNPSNVYVNGYKGEDEVKTPILREVNRNLAYEDPRSIFSNPNIKDKNFDNNQSKSILRNKAEVSKETHHTPLQVPNKKQKKKKSSLNEEEYMSAYNKVMHDVVEKPLTSPDPLPQEKFIDAHAPKKRVSRFKQTRGVPEKQNS